MSADERETLPATPARPPEPQRPSPMVGARPPQRTTSVNSLPLKRQAQLARRIEDPELREQAVSYLERRVRDEQRKRKAKRKRAKAARRRNR